MWQSISAGVTQRASSERCVSAVPAGSASLERHDGDAWVPEIDASGLRAVNDRVVELIGLSYDTFVRSVLQRNT